METKNPLASVIKRLNFLMILVVATVSIATGYICGSEAYQNEIRSAKIAATLDVPPTEEELSNLDANANSKKESGPWEKYRKRPFDPVKYLKDKNALNEAISAAATKRVALISVIPFVGLCMGNSLGIMACFILLMMTISWLIGYKFKVHASTK